MEESRIDIEHIIEDEQVVIHFQPIISTYYDRVSGVEALVRGIDPQGAIIPPLTLFACAREAHKVIELDRLCQRKAIASFAKRREEEKDLILFLNVDNSVIHLDRDTNAIYNYCIDSGVSPGSVVLEINELQTVNIGAVLKFVTHYRDLGFMISIDDIGAGYSNLDRLVVLKPDIIKIDRHLIHAIHEHYYKQQVVDMIIKLAEKTGALVVAEGVEELEEILTVLQYGAQLLQGYYIARPMDMKTSRLDDINEKISHIAEEQKLYLSDHLQRKCDFNLKLRERFNAFNQGLLKSEQKVLSEALKDLLKDYPEVECAYVISEDGIQLTDTVFNSTLPKIHRKSLFSPYKKGGDAKLKAYYYVLKTTNQPQYVSDEYLSLASGHKCRTISGYSHFTGGQCILCLDVISQDID